MHPASTITAAAVAILTALPSVTAHGYVTNAIIGGVTSYIGSPLWYYSSTKPTQAVWYALDQDSGFVSPTAYSSPDITCHISATPANSFITVAAGSTFGLQWNTWPADSHKGPVLNYLAPVTGDWTAIDKTKLQFFAIQTSGLINDDTPPGYWATDVLTANNFTGSITIPASLAPGNYVLRHEIIALHGGENLNGAQNYPQCVNVKITGSGTAVPSTAAGADIRVGTAFYTNTDPGILFNIYAKITSYPIPGLALWSGAGGSSSPPKSTTSAVQTTITNTFSSLPHGPTSTFQTSTSSKVTSTTSSAVAGASCAAKYAQCGGQGWGGATCCVAGSTCKASGQYYSQCQ